MKPYILDDASTLEYQRLDLMSKILDPWTRGYLTEGGRVKQCTLRCGATRV
jgi:hypothetical protein